MFRDSLCFIEDWVSQLLELSRLPHAVGTKIIADPPPERLDEAVDEVGDFSMDEDMGALGASFISPYSSAGQKLTDDDSLEAARGPNDEEDEEKVERGDAKELVDAAIAAYEVLEPILDERSHAAAEIEDETFELPEEDADAEALDESLELPKAFG